MKLILSRKGFDSTAGGAASPIFPDGRMISLPIPDPRSPVRYRDLALGELVEQLTRGRQRGGGRAHLDPDLVAAARPRPRGWRPLFGQTSAAQTVLARGGVGPGDLFLFFGWFRRVERHGGRHGGRWRFVPGAPDLHVLWGWLQIAEVVDVAAGGVPRWAAEHPHVAFAARPRNTLYVARRRLALDGAGGSRPGAGAGAGVFSRFDPRLVLTREGASRSVWSLPGWFRGADLGYHAEPWRWTPRGARVELQSAARGQEFIVDSARQPASARWLAEIFDQRLFE